VIGDEYLAFRDFSKEQVMVEAMDMERIAKGLGAERRGKVSPRGGYFGALQFAAEVAARFRVPEGARATEVVPGQKPIRDGRQNS
jgi:hypothetical protein